MKGLGVKSLVLFSSVATLVALVMMTVSIVFPRPLLLVLAMSVAYLPNAARAGPSCRTRD